MNMLTSTLLLLAAMGNLTLLVMVLRRTSKPSIDPLDPVRTELRLGRDEARTSSKELREEVSNRIQVMDDALRGIFASHGQLQQTHHSGMATQMRELSESNRSASDGLRSTIDSRIKDLQDSNDKKLVEIRTQVADGLKATGDSVTATLGQMSQAQQALLSELTGQVKALTDSNQSTLDRIRTTLDTRIHELQEGNDKKLGDIRVEVNAGLKTASDSVNTVMQQTGATQQEKLEGMTQQLRELATRNQDSLEAVRTALDSRVKEMQENNDKKLEEMRRTVDEKLHDTLEKRLGESFKLVSDRLESVHKGLGEMQNLAAGVGDLKRVLTNVKTRGTWAEVQLGAILDQMLTPEQFARNVCVREGSAERVEFAIKLPGPKDDPTRCVWLPIDSKFLNEDYARLQSAAESGDPVAVQAASDALLRAFRSAARDIHEKYVNPPTTTDFAIMFLATEGLYAEALRLPAFVEELQQRYRVVIAGPTTLAAILSSLRMGFQTLAVEQRAAEVWRVLGGVKTEFGKFGTWLGKVQRQLQTATKTIEETGTRTRAMERRLRSVEQLGPAETATILKLPGMGEIDVQEGANDEEAAGDQPPIDPVDADTRN
jgi:DNA recombination protein RmuC